MTDPNSAPAVPKDQHERRRPYRDEAAGRIPPGGVATIHGRWLTLGALLQLSSLTGHTHAAPSPLPGCTVNLSRHPGPRPVSLRFAGDAYYESAAAQLKVDLSPRRR